MFFRIHTAEIAYLTQKPRGLFVAVGKLVDGGALTEAETTEYWRQRRWFEEHLPVPPFYADGNSIKAITWYKDNDFGRAMAQRMGFYRSMAQKYGVELFRTSTTDVPGTLVYEDDWQIGVVESLHGGPGFQTNPL